MNVVLLLTDTQCKRMVGAYGEPVFDTPNLDRLASEGVRFERAYAASPVCTPARGAIFTGLYPQMNGAWANCLTPQRHVPMMGEIVRHHGYRAGYTGKWHLDGSGYDGVGEADGGFEPEWWFDRVNMLNELPDHLRQLYSQKTTVEQLREADFRDEHVFGHRVADRAVDFLENVGDDPFVLVASFDEPHDPWMTPPDWWEYFEADDIPGRPNYCPSMEGKPHLQQVAAQEIAEAHGHPTWRDLVAKRLKFFGCNSYIDREIGRVVDAVDAHHADDTLIIYLSDHGDQLGSHGLHDKGAYMYEETCNVPLIVRSPDGPRGAVSHALASQLDILPTVLDYIGAEIPPSLDGRSLRPVLEDPDAHVHEHVMVSFNRFQLGAAGRGGMWPIRCLVDDRYKLAINLHDRDELYDLKEEPYELTNCIDEPAYARQRDRLHDALLAEMRRSRDPMMNWLFEDRPWRPAAHHYVPAPGSSVDRPRGFSFQW